LIGKLVVLDFDLVVKLLLFNGSLFKSVVSLPLKFIFIDHDIVVSFEKFKQVISLISLRGSGCTQAKELVDIWLYSGLGTHNVATICANRVIWGFELEDLISEVGIFDLN
jgi:hypothetical protein